MPTTVIGYGSLMSAYGLGRRQWGASARVARVELRNARRGFGKASIRGDRYSMVVEPVDPAQPICARSAAFETPGEGPQGLAFEVGRADLLALARREGYAAAALSKLAAMGLDSTGGVAGQLAEIMDACAGDVVRYRERLRDRLDYTSAHYIPHPIAFDGAWAVIFLAPGREGSGCAAVTPVRVLTGVCELMSTDEVWRRNPNRSQLDYIAMCLVAAAHGIRVDDLAQVSADLARSLAEYATRFGEEPERLRRTLGISSDAYRRFAGPTDGWRW